MIARLDLRGDTPSRAELLAAVPRATTEGPSAADAAADLIADVRTRGSGALLDQAERFDGGCPPSLRVDPGEIARAVGDLPRAVRDALEESIDRVRTASRVQIPPPAVTEPAAGARIVQRWMPVGRVGLYVPGGKAAYPSSVVMNVVPAQVAGVAELAMASPPQAAHGFRVHPLILGAAGLLGIDEVYAMGGAGAVAAFAYGVPDAGIAPVDLVTGPGNRFVAAAKRLVRGVVGVDSEAGTTEVLVIADETADPRWVAADLISQAEHDEYAAAVLVTTSARLADDVAAELSVQAATTASGDRVAAALSGSQSAIVLVDDLETAARFSDAYAPEHLEIQTRAPGELLDLIHDAGAIFLGAHTPVSLGDYLAGSNHVLPTAGGARFSAGLSAATFLRAQQVVEYDAGALGRVAPHIRALSDAEGLPAHGDAVDIRLA
ncbi:MAG: histidinol dehydrogenase [Micrococcales bacterium]|nr:histidinol dehydrogenase [Micrococcales bacterium]